MRGSRLTGFHFRSAEERGECMEYLPLIVGLGTGVDSASKRNSHRESDSWRTPAGDFGGCDCFCWDIGTGRCSDLDASASGYRGDLVRSWRYRGLVAGGSGLIHVEAVPESEDIQPGAATLVDLLIRGELGKERRSLRFVLFDEDTDLEAEAPPLSERRHLSFSTPGMGKSPELKLMEMKPADSVTLNLTWRSHWVSVPLLVIILAILALIGSAMEAAVPNGMARTFLSVTLGIGAFFAWNIQDGLPADGAVKAVLVALAWSFAEGAVLGSLIPGWLTRVVPEGPVGTGGE